MACNPNQGSEDQLVLPEQFPKLTSGAILQKRVTWEL